MNNNISRLGDVLLLLAAIAILVMAVATFGARFGLWEAVAGYSFIRSYLTPVGFSVIGVSAVGLVYLMIKGQRRAMIKAGTACLIGLLLLAPMIATHVKAPVKTPRIYDVTTDTVNPPPFLVLDDTRPEAKNSLVYGGPEVAALQKEAYPDILPIMTELSAEDAFSKALGVAQDMGWEIVAQDPAALRYEAISYTPVFYFPDDIVVRVTAEGSGSRVDIRSVSRIGKNDQGANAARIRKFIENFQG